MKRSPWWQRAASDDQVEKPDELPDSICPLPWVNLSMDVDGSSRPCCKYVPRATDSPYEFSNLRDAPLNEVWHSDGLRMLRRDFRAGVKPTECSTCWDEEAAGIASYRQTFVKYRGLTADVDYDNDSPPAPAALDLKLSNACNLKCRICGPVASSLWLQEELSVAGPEPDSFLAELKSDRTYFLSNKITHDPENYKTLHSWLPSIEYLELTGGEPMLSPENRELIELIASDGFPEQIGILFNTNATVIDDRILNHLDRYREVRICLSIDDIEERFEYQRAPASWSEVELNLERYQQVASSDWQLYAFCSVSVFNVWYLPEYIRWVTSQKRRVPLQLVLNLVHYPRHFSIQVLPTQAKQALRQRLADELIDNPETPPEALSAVEDVLHFLDGSRSDDAANWKKCIEVIEERDGIRGEHFVRVFPQLAQQLQEAGAWQDGTSVDLG